MANDSAESPTTALELLQTSLDPSGGRAGSLDQDDALADSALAKEISEAIQSGASLSDIARLLDVPSSKLAATVRRERRKLALILWEGAITGVPELATRYHKLMLKVVEMLEDKITNTPVDKFSPSQLVTIGEAIARWLRPIHEALLLKPLGAEHGADSPKAQLQVTQQTVQFLMEQGEAIRRAAEVPQRLHIQGDPGLAISERSVPTVPPEPEHESEEPDAQA